MKKNETRGSWFARLTLVPLVLLLCSVGGAATNGSANGDWVSIGVPTSMYVGSTGFFYLIGDDIGSCANTVPTYFRSNMSEEHWKELYSLLLYSHAQKKPLMCVAASGCGSTEIWITYCRLALQ